MSAAVDNCTECGASFLGDPIPDYPHLEDCEEQRDRSEARGSGRLCFCKPYGESRHFRREMGHEVRGVYDGVLFWSCPDCEYAWPRFNDNLGRLSHEATKYAVQHNERRQVRSEATS